MAFQLPAEEIEKLDIIKMVFEVRETFRSKKISLPPQALVYEEIAVTQSEKFGELWVHHTPYITPMIDMHGDLSHQV